MQPHADFVPNITRAKPSSRCTEIKQVECINRTGCLVFLMRSRPLVDITCGGNACQDTKIATELIKSQLDVKEITKNDNLHSITHRDISCLFLAHFSATTLITELTGRLKPWLDVTGCCSHFEFESWESDN